MIQYILFICLIIFYVRWEYPIQLPAQNHLYFGTIASLPEKYGNAKQFIFIPEKTKNKIWVSWFKPPPVHLHAGDVWELQLKVKPTQKTWLLAENINGIATVQMNFHNQIIEKHPWRYPVSHMREIIYAHLKSTLQDNPSLGFISALTIGMRDNITQPQWNDLRGTGTNHLMAIAGLHIGFMTAMAFALMNFCWRRKAALMLWLPAQEAATLFALGMAFIYSALSGFALPTQRALIMLSVFLLSFLSRKTISPWTSYFLALGFILAFDPLCVLTPTFWLSFCAVGLLIYSGSGRIGKPTLWQHWAQAQWVMAIGLIPLSLCFFQQFSFTAFIANCIAIPIVGFIILPLCLLGIIFPICWQLAANLMNHLWVLMHWLATLPYSQYTVLPDAVSPAVFISSLLGILLLLAPKGWPHRWIGLGGFFPLVWLIHH